MSYTKGIATSALLLALVASALGGTRAPAPRTLTREEMRSRFGGDMIMYCCQDISQCVATAVACSSYTVAQCPGKFGIYPNPGTTKQCTKTSNPSNMCNQSTTQHVCSNWYACQISKTTGLCTENLGQNTTYDAPDTCQDFGCP
jgi:hypothetical protein